MSSEAKIDGDASQRHPTNKQTQETPDLASKGVSAPASAAAAAPPPAKPAKLSAAELKAKKKAEKAARRAQVVDAKTHNEAAAHPPTPSGGDSKGNKQNKAKQDGTALSGSAAQNRLNVQRRQSVGKQQAPIPEFRTHAGPKIPECFSHLPMAKRIQLSEADKDVNPAVLAIGQQMAAFTLRDNIARLEAALLAFRKVIESYESPKSHVFSRHFVPHVLNPQIDYLTECRPMCFAMGNAVRMLKSRVTELDLEMPDDSAKSELVQAIDTFRRERIILAEYIITKNAAEMIADGDFILTYGHQRLVRKGLQLAWSNGRKFEVAIVDDPYEQSGRDLAKILRHQGTRVFYYPNLAGLSTHVRQATKVLLGAEAMFANGSLYGPAGTCDIAMAATDVGIPTIALCETVNFDRDRVATDSLTYNEIDPDRSTEDSFRLLFDTTRDRYISMVVTEYETGSGNSPAGAILSLLRKQDDPR